MAVAGGLAPATGAFAQTSATEAGTTQAGTTQTSLNSEPTVGIRLLEAPTALANDPRARIYIIDHVAPGAMLSRRVAVTSSANVPVRVDLYGGAATIDGGSFLAQPQSQGNDLSSWIAVNPSFVVVPPHGESTATVTINVPNNAASGERYGVVWAQPPAATGSSGISEINRVGVRVYLSVGTGVAPATDFTITSLTAARYPSGTPYVKALVHNTGGRALDLSGFLDLTNGPGGVRAGPFPAKLGTTLGIGQTEPVTIPLDRNIPSGPWTADVILTSDQVTREVKGIISFPTVAGTSGIPIVATPVHHHRGKSFIFLTVIAGIVLVAVLLLLLLVWRRRKEEEANEDHQKPVRVGAAR